MYDLPPVSEISIFQNGDIKVHRKKWKEGEHEKDAAVRGKVTHLSRRSLTNLMMTTRLSRHHFLSMITLTYPEKYPQNGKVVKSHLNVMLQKLRRMFGTKSFVYVWFLEFQARGAPHIHILLSCSLPESEIKLEQFWRSWASLTTDNEVDYQKVMYVHNERGRAWEEIRDTNGAAKYVTKYAVKNYQKAVPTPFQDVGRFWGASRDIREEPVKIIEIDEDTLRAVLEQEGHKANSFDILPKWIWSLKSFRDD